MNLDIINKVLLSNYNKIYLIDIIKDETYIYNTGNGLEISTKITYTEYLENLKSKLSEEDFNKLSLYLSINKLEEEKQNGKNIVDITISNKDTKYILNISLIEDNNNKYIAIFSEILYPSIENTTINNNDNNLDLDKISNYLLKIYNIVNTNSDNNEVKTINNYINNTLNELVSEYPSLKKSFTNNATNLSLNANATILVIDDDNMTRTILKKIFENKYKVIEATNGKEAIDILNDNINHNIYEAKDNIECIFLDLVMPEVDGFAVLDYLKENNYLGKIPIAIISGDYSKETREKVYQYPIADMLEKPFNTEIISLRINNLINLYKSSNSLNELLSNQYSDLKIVTDSITSSYLIDYKEKIDKLSKFINILGNKIAFDYPEYKLNNDIVTKISNASKYYDIGYYSIPKKVLNNPNLTSEEENIIKNYPNIGKYITKYILKNNDDHTLIKYATEITNHYHERYNGSGYPDKLSGDNIPISAMIASIGIDYINLLDKYNHDYAKVNNEIIVGANFKYNPKFIEAFKQVIKELEKIS